MLGIVEGGTKDFGGCFGSPWTSGRCWWRLCFNREPVLQSGSRGGGFVGGFVEGCTDPELLPEATLGSVKFIRFLLWFCIR